jgi:hypothetical protein
MSPHFESLCSAKISTIFWQQCSYQHAVLELPKPTKAGSNYYGVENGALTRYSSETSTQNFSLLQQQRFETG